MSSGFGTDQDILSLYRGLVVVEDGSHRIEYVSKKGDWLLSIAV